MPSNSGLAPDLFIGQGWMIINAFIFYLHLKLKYPMMYIFMFYFFYFGVTPCSMQDLSSTTRDRTHAPCSGSTES